METKTLLNGNEKHGLRKHEPRQFYRFVILCILLSFLISFVLFIPTLFQCQQVSSPIVYPKQDIQNTATETVFASENLKQSSSLNDLAPRPTIKNVERPSSILFATESFVNSELQLNPAFVESLLSSHKAVCPLSFNTILDMLSKGLESEALEELQFITRTQNALKLDEKVITSKNSIWNVGLFSEKFLNAVEPRKALKFESVSVKAVNTWVKDATNGRISEFVKEVNEKDGLIINVVLFKALWSQRFYSKNELFSFNNVPNAAKMMSSTSFYAVHLDQEDKPNAIIVPFERGYSAILSMPYDPTLKIADFRGRHVSLTMPHFEIESELFDLSTDLKSMGVQKMFEGSNRVQQILHKVAIKVNEYGCEAVAVTAAVIPRSAGFESDPIEFVLDKTFGFVIVHDETETEIFKAIIDTAAVQAAAN